MYSKIGDFGFMSYLERDPNKLKAILVKKDIFKDVNPRKFATDMDAEIALQKVAPHLFMFEYNDEYNVLVNGEQKQLYRLAHKSSNTLRVPIEGTDDCVFIEINTHIMKNFKLNKAD